MKISTRAALSGVVAAGFVLAVAAAGASEWRWGVAALGVATAAGLSFWQVAGSRGGFRRPLEELKQATAEVAAAAEQLSASSQSVAQGASEQAASLEQTGASGKELDSSTQKNAESARTAAEVVRESERQVAGANQTLAEMMSSMSEINEASDKIAKIIKVIDEIAFQTNILALNAAVEAARAGEAGMGFAVVADEVRNLAQRSAQAAKDTAGMIEESITKSSEGTKKLDRVKEAIAAITESSTKVKALVEEVSAGCQEQAAGFATISESITEMGQVTQRSAASAQESASASEELTAQTRSMKKALQSLWSMVLGEEPASSEISGPRPAPSVAREARVPIAAAAPVELDITSPEEAFPLDDDFR